MKPFTELRIVFTVITGILAIGIAYMDMLDGAGPDVATKFRAWCSRIWEQVTGMGWMELPRPVVTWLVKAKVQLPNRFREVLRRRSNVTMFLWLVATVLFTMMHPSATHMTNNGPVAASERSRAIGVLAVILVLIIAAICLRTRFPRFDTFVGALFQLYNVWNIVCIGLQFSLFWSSVILTLMTSRMCLFFACGFRDLYASLFGKASEDVFLFGLCVPFSFEITLAALIFGHYIDSALWVPGAGQLMLSNVLFDSLTVVMTISILAWAVPEANPKGVEPAETESVARKGGSLLVAIPTACLAAGIFSCASLWFGLASSPHALSLLETYHAMIGRSPDGHRWSFGPLFWTMHTTFIPVLIVLGAIILLWIARLFVISPVYGWLGMSKEEKASPFKVTKGFLGIWAALFGILAGCSWFLSETIPKETQTHSAVTIQKHNTP